MDNMKEISQLHSQQEHVQHVSVSSDALLSTLWDTTPDDLLAVINEQFTLVTCNANFRQHFLQYLGKPIVEDTNILHALASNIDVQITYKENCVRALQGETTMLQCTLYDKDLNPRFYTVTLCPIFDVHHICTGILHIMRDITVQVEAQQEVLRLNDQYNQTMQEYTLQMQKMHRLQDNFVAVISHEFRTTLTGIQGFSELLCDQGLSMAEIQEYAIDINTDARRLSRIVNTLLDLQLMRSGRLVMHQELIDLHALLQKTVEQMSINESSHHIILQSKAQFGCCIGDKENLMQMMYHLLSNAVKYSPVGSDIIVRGLREGVILHVSVQDYGRGIPEDALSEIFETYNQVSMQKTRHIQGTGLGLALVRQIVQMHGGTVWAESEPGQGATFHVTLPMQLNATIHPLVTHGAGTVAGSKEVSPVMGKNSS